MKLRFKPMYYGVDENKNVVEVGIPYEFLFDADQATAVFIHDLLIDFKDINDSAPQEYLDMAKGNIEQAIEYFNEDLEALAAQFEYISEHVNDKKELIQPYVDTAFAKLSKIFLHLFK